jgi:hypothetical protein
MTLKEHKIEQGLISKLNDPECTLRFAIRDCTANERTLLINLVLLARDVNRDIYEV